MSHTFTSLRYHLVFSTKNRAPSITPEIGERLYPYIGGIIRHHGGSLTEIGGIADHVHVLATFRPRYSVSEMLKEIKGGSSSWLNDQPFCRDHFAWQPGYAAFSVSESVVAEVQRYIQRQEEHHRTRTYQDELEALLKRHGIAYTERDLRP